MTYTVLGKRPVSFTASDGKTITGTTCDKLFITADKMPKAEIVVGKDVEIYFNRYGKVDKIVPIV